MGENSKGNWATAKKSCFCLFTLCTGISCSIRQPPHLRIPPDLGIPNIFDSFFLGKEIGFCLNILRCLCGFHPFQSSTLIFSCCFPSSSHHFLPKPLSWEHIVPKPVENVINIIYRSLRSQNRHEIFSM